MVLVLVLVDGVGVGVWMCGYVGGCLDERVVQMKVNLKNEVQIALVATLVVDAEDGQEYQLR